MEWNRGPGQTQPASQPVNHSAATHKSNSSFMNLRTASVALVLSIAILVLAVCGSIVFTKKPSSQNKFVDSSKMQAVFLNGGQVYFGKITNLNDRFIHVSQIYYLRVNQQVQPNGQATTGQDISLVKLGCELHGPQDNMVINQSQVIFWENLKDNGQVAQAVAKYKKDNPGEQKCDAPAANNGGTTTTTPTPATTPATPATPTKKP